MPRRRRRLGCLGLVGLLVIGLAAGGLAIRVGCPRPPELPSPVGTVEPGTPPENVRREESTYLTFPEWYIVYAARDEAAWLRRSPPSGFPYLRAVGQFWCGYSAVVDVTSTRYGFNSDNHLMLVLIGTSFTAEYAIRGLYEGTVGRATEALGGWDTDVDRFAAELAAEYAAFMDQTPWYDFPFGDRLGALWALPGAGGSPLRRWERRLSLSAQLAVKAGYGRAIGAAAGVVYSTENPTTVVLIERGASAPPGLVVLPRYAAFQPALLKLLRGGADPRAIAGNHELLLTLLAPASWRYGLAQGIVLFEQPLLVDPARKRLGVSVPVRGLRPIVAELERPGVEIEHVYDY